MSETPMSRIWKRLLELTGVTHSGKRRFELDADLFQALRGLAARQRRPADQVAGDLLSDALSQHTQWAARQPYIQQYWQRLSPREREVARLACAHYTNPQIAVALSISTATVKTHMRNILFKSGARNRAELFELLEGWEGW